MDPHHTYTTTSYTTDHHGAAAPGSYTSGNTPLHYSGTYGNAGATPGLSYSYTQEVKSVLDSPLRKSIAAGDIGITTGPTSYGNYTTTGATGHGLSGSYLNQQAATPTSYTSSHYAAGPGITQSYAVDRTTHESPLKKSYTITNDVAAPASYTAHGTTGLSGTHGATRLSGTHGATGLVDTHSYGTTNYGTHGATGLSGTHGGLSGSHTYTTTNYGTHGATGLSGTHGNAGLSGSQTYTSTSYAAPTSYTATSYTNPTTHTAAPGSASADVQDIFKKLGISGVGQSTGSATTDPHKVWQQINPTPEVHSHTSGLYTNLPPSSTHHTSYTATSQPSSYTATQPVSYTATHTATQPASYGTHTSSYTATQPTSYSTHVTTPLTPEKKSADYSVNVQRGAEGAKQSRAYGTVPLKSEPRQSILSPYRHSMYPEFEMVEDFPDRSNLIDSINTFLTRSPAKESLLVSPSRVSIKRQSMLSPAEIDVQSLVKEKYEDGSIYEGEGRNGRRHGKGRLTFRDGRVFQGQWRDGRAEGNAIIYYRNGKVCYEGGVDDTVFQGRGVLQCEAPIPLQGGFDPNNFGSLGNHWTKYDGEFRAGKRNGQGTLYLTNGEKFTGEFRDDKIEGKGSFQARDGRAIQGVWENNVLRRNL